MTHDENSRTDYKTMWEIMHENNQLKEQLNYVVRELHNVCRSTNRSMSKISSELYKEMNQKRKE